MAEHRDAQPGGDPTMIGMAVSEYDAFCPAPLIRRLPDAVGHRPRAGVEDRHAAVIFEQVDVHAMPHVAGVPPHAVGDAFGDRREHRRAVYGPTMPTCREAG